MPGNAHWCHRCGMLYADCPCTGLVPIAESLAVPAESGERPRRDHIITYARTLLPQCLASMSFERWRTQHNWVAGAGGDSWVTWRDDVPVHRSHADLQQDYQLARDEAAWRDAIALAERTFNGEPTQ